MIIINFLVFDLFVSEDFLIFIHATVNIDNFSHFQDLCALEQFFGSLNLVFLEHF